MPAVRKPSPAMVVAVIALIVAMGGTAAAAGYITGAAIKDNTLTSRDVRNGSLSGRDLHANTVTGSNIRNGTIRGRDLRGSVITAATMTSGAAQTIIVGAKVSIDVRCPGGTQALSGAYVSVDNRGDVPEGFTVTSSFPLEDAPEGWRFVVINAGRGAVSFTPSVNCGYPLPR